MITLSATSAAAFMTNEEKADRHRQLKLSVEPFAHMLAHIYTIMPHPGYIIQDGTFELLPPLPQWQERIDKIIEMRNEYIKDNFPEFYTEKTSL